MISGEDGLHFLGEKKHHLFIATFIDFKKNNISKSNSNKEPENDKNNEEPVLTDRKGTSKATEQKRLKEEQERLAKEAEEKRKKDMKKQFQ